MSDWKRASLRDVRKGDRFAVVGGLGGTYRAVGSARRTRRGVTGGDGYVEVRTDRGIGGGAYHTVRMHGSAPVDVLREETARARKRPSYRDGVEIIALNDDAEEMDPEVVAGYVSVMLLAELFGRERERVAADVVRRRGEGG